MKKFINSHDDFVRETLEGMVAAHDGTLMVDFDPTFVYRTTSPALGRVAVISGGGSGHEPLHAGFVGAGMLDAACPGEIFSSPTPDQMLAALEKVVDPNHGALFIVKNYGGDVMNFEMAMELAQASGMLVNSVIVDDDIATTSTTQGRRGTGTTLIAEKICGAAAEKGYDLPLLTDLCQDVVLAGRSFGIALTSCTVPGKGSPTLEIGEDEMEVGVGIHGEAGVKRVKVQNADAIAEAMATIILSDKNYQRMVKVCDSNSGETKEKSMVSRAIKPKDNILLFVNGLGGTSLAELYVIYRKVAEVCKSHRVKVVRSLVGSYITSLDMSGVTVTMVRMNDDFLKFWDMPVNTPALRWRW